MKTNIYKVTNKDYTGAAFAMYEGRMLTMLLVDFKLATQHPRLASENFPLSEDELLDHSVFTATALKPKTVSEKVALFCLLYKKHKATTYRTTKQDRANIVHVSVNETLLNTYFKATQYPLAGLKSISDYVRHYNEVRDLATNGTPAKKSSFPDVYDKQYEHMIGDDVVKLQRYWAHLRLMGWAKVDGAWKHEDPKPVKP